MYPYEPSIIAALIAAGVFGLSAALHTFVVAKKKTWFYSCLIVGAWMMTAGYVFRILSSKSPNEMILYIMQSLFIILPPSLYAATIYMIYGRIALFVRCPQASLISPHKITKIFVVGDLFAFLLQASGGGMMAMASLADIGQKIVLVGLFIQIIFFGLFLIVSIIFLKRMAVPGAGNPISRGKRSWQALFIILLVASAVILARCIFRIMEFAQGHNGELASNELLIYLFDALPMAAVQILFHVVHAGDVFNDQVGFTKFDNDTELALNQV
ncbi:RTA1 like protein-domain-containing protein [Fusarium oxysporum Fo47]|nr:RTA1 like protein-domain-containing protein [Fusarium oxysporum Fo47]XP_054562335.2 RTA1 like protein-domain-containing protein [Fusarium oxysporum Fo47]QKD56924.2 RTA1 like protein-domain-containing protein [Fusarium oxysporum Fo47]QKD57891.2 RTA1 like protein-domain-containing protein [Fusarium oxysporum Fo47]